MQTAKQKVNDAAASAKEHVDVLKAKAEGKVDKTVHFTLPCEALPHEVASTLPDKTAASTKEDKEVAKEQKKAKEAEANMKKHEDKAGNAAQHLQGKQQGHFGQHAPLAGVGAAPVNQGGQHLTGDTVPPSHTVAPGGDSDQYDSTVPVSTNAAAPPQGTLDGHHPGPN